ncbi:MAG: DUF1588 domain-containing protein [Acidobacteria bacterium]|nr:DUF1588 domain-containing protein [Acidobacteriota bacterium]
MSFRVAIIVAGVLLTGAGVWAQQQSPTPPSLAARAMLAPSSVAMTEAAQNALVEEYCSACHSRTAKSGDVVLDGFNVASPLLSAELLERMIRKVRAGQMPPANSERPSRDETAAFVDALEARADALAARAPDPGWRPFQRLNRAEYALVIKGWLGVEIDPSAILPPDTISGGFDNIADVQTVSPTLINAYLRGAAMVSRAAVAASNAASRARVFSCLPTSPAEETACADTIFRRLLAVAYRGTSTDADVTDALALYRQGRSRTSFDEGIRLALESMLVNPKFLFRVEPTTSSGAITDLALASRLSFFLWSQGPDAALVAAAARGELHTPEQLASQARRMLVDPRATTLSTRFAAQWLRLQDLDTSTPLTLAMRRQTELDVADLVTRDGSVLELITSDRSHINEQLAVHYGIANVRGDHFRVVPMPAVRRGLLGHGSILTLTSLVTRTSPVLRGKWVLDVLLGTPPPPPPPNVPALDDSVKPTRNGTALSTRQRVEQHRSNPACSGCHRVIDPPGMTLEQFDATGAWREADNGVAIDADAQLYDGRYMSGPAGLRAALLDHQDMFVRNFTQQLMTYALGRRLSYRDMPTVRRIVRSAASDGNRISAFVNGIVTSDAFRFSRPKQSP